MTSENDAADDNMTFTTDQKLDLILKEITELKNQNIKYNSDISGIKESIDELKRDITVSIDFCYFEIADTEKDVKVNKDNISFHERQIETLSGELEVVKRQLADLQQKIATNNQFSRSNCLEISGVPEVKNEDTMAVVRSVAKALNLELKDRMVDAVHRLAKNPQNPEMPRGIILKFCRRIDMEAMRSMTRVKNGFSAAELGSASESKIFINLSMTRHTRLLWSAVRAFKQECGYKYARITSTGKVFLHRTDNSRVILINGKSDREKLTRPIQKMNVRTWKHQNEHT